LFALDSVRGPSWRPAADPEGLAEADFPRWSQESFSPSVLSVRLKELQEARLVERTLEGYVLTDLGRELFTLIEPLDAYSLKWGKAL
jgi:hypothetical protein